MPHPDGRPCRLIITSMKNEGPHIVEWIAYHRVIGFTDFLVYTNDCEDGTVAILDRLAEMGVLTHQPNEVLRRGPQKSALKWARDHPLTAAADWIMVSDIDEFLNVRLGDGGVQDLIDAVPDADVIPVTWRLFSHDGRVEFEDAPVIAQFTDAERPLEAGGFPDRFVKSLFRPSPAITRFGTHGPIAEAAANLCWRQPDGRRLGAGDNLTRPARAFAYEAAQINHYAVCAVDSYLVKKDRGRVNHWRQVMGLDYWRRMCRGGEEDRTILAKLDETKAEAARLLADPRLAELHAGSVRWRRDRIAALREAPDFEGLRQRILDLSAAADHKRRADATPPSDSAPEGARAKNRPSSPEPSPPAPSSPEPSSPDPAPTAEAAEARFGALMAEMRTLLPALGPIEATEAAEARLAEIEIGLLGARAGR